MLSKKTHVHDLDKLTYKEWVCFVFDHPIVAGRRKKEWYFEEAWDFQYHDGVLQSTYLTHLFNNPRFLLRNYSDKQIEQGMWFLLYSGDLLGKLLKDKKLKFFYKRKIIHSIENLYEKLFRVKEVGFCVNMFWDLVAGNYFCYPTPQKPLSKLDKKIQNEMFYALVNILKIKKDYIQRAALHGLGHLKHSKTKQVIEGYLKRNPKLSEHDIKYAKECISERIR